MLDGCDDARLGEAVGLGKRKTMSNRPQTTSSESWDLPRRCAKCCCGDRRRASAKLGETHATKNQHELPTNAGIKRRRSRPLEWDVRRLRRGALGRGCWPGRAKNDEQPTPTNYQLW